MDILLDISLEDSGSGRLVETSSLQDVCCVDPIVMSATHNMLFQVTTKLELIDGNLGIKLAAIPKKTVCQI